MLARISGRLGLSNDEIGASVREMFPEHFEPSEDGNEAPRESEAILSDETDATHDQAAVPESSARGAA